MKREGTIDAPEVPPVGMTTALVAPDSAWELVENLVLTEEGGFRSVYTPVPVTPNSSGVVPTNGSPNPTTPVYGPCYGIFHARLKEGQRDILLLHTGTELWEFAGHLRQWKVLVNSDGSNNAQIVMDLPTPLWSDAPTQFVSTPTGIIIIPQRGRALFYDGDTILPLGYEEPPSPPVGNGPNSSSYKWFPDHDQPFLGVNDTGYTMDGIPNHPPSSMNPVWRSGRIGQVDTPGNVTHLADPSNTKDGSQVMGYLLPGRMRAKVQYIDLWGNLSPFSGESNDVEWKRQPSMSLVETGNPSPFYTLEWVHADLVRKQIAWDGISAGPPGTIGRILVRTKDLVNSGDTKFYLLPRDSVVTENAFATLPDNLSTCYPDNIPDAWLLAEQPDVAPFPRVRLAELAFGRAFYADVVDDEGAVLWSEVGRWGTILTKSKFYPDPAGARVTAIRRAGNGLFAFTGSSLLRIVQNDSGDGFKAEPVPCPVGTVSPNTVRQHQSGMLCWLGTDGNVYGFDGSQVVNLWRELRQARQRIQLGRLPRACAVYDPTSQEYRLWAPRLGAEWNSVCYTFDGATWRQRTECWADDACVTQDHRRLILAAGRVDDYDRNGPWVLDRAGNVGTARLKTAWLTSTRSQERKSVFTVFLHLRETGAPVAGETLTVKVRQNYRSEVTETHALPAHYPALDTSFNSSAPNPTLWDTSPIAYTQTLGGTGAKWRTRRPYWVKVDISAPSAEVVQLEFSSVGKVEIIGYSLTERPRDTQGAMNTRSSRT